MTEVSETVNVFKALADETRLRIIEMLSCGALCACQILGSFDITQPTLSYHLKILTACDLIHARKEGMWTWYSLNLQTIDNLKACFEEITTDTDDCVCSSIECCPSENESEVLCCNQVNRSE